ncbi:MAG: hypothetical protein IPL53_20600 [Ignavibacteria bacterium]|nr:hypothetical protein [Ignavibacteria bacterium]
MYKNNIAARDVGIHLAGHCYPNLSNYKSGSNLIWTGGFNIINTEELDNIQLSSSGLPKTDFGNNNFSINNSSAYHIYGWIDSSHTIYNSRRTAGMAHTSQRFI